LYRDEFIAMVRLAHLLTGSNVAAEDIAQEAFLRLEGRLDELNNPGGYLRTIVVNLSRNWQRSRARRGDRLFGRDTPPAVQSADDAAPGSGQSTSTQVTARIFGGSETLEVVGESYRQDALWTIVDAARGTEVRHAIYALLYPETSNPHDSNTISVQVDGDLVGYLSREDAAVYRPGLLALMAQQEGKYIALEGWIVGGGGGRSSLGVFLDHDPEDFGLSSSSPPPIHRGAMRSGFSEAWLADADDDDYDLSWFNELPDGDRAGIAKLRELLAIDPDPIDRHFQFAELECRLYRSRELHESALDEYDEACRQHDVEMDVICEQFVAKFGKVPLLGTYRQMAIRQQKLKNWEAVLWWVERGLSLYGEDAARDQAVEDLTKRRNRARRNSPVPFRCQGPGVLRLARSRHLSPARSCSILTSKRQAR